LTDQTVRSAATHRFAAAVRLFGYKAREQRYGAFPASKFSGTFGEVFRSVSGFREPRVASAATSDGGFS